jgi:hypothetical protein
LNLRHQIKDLERAKPGALLHNAIATVFPDCKHQYIMYHSISPKTGTTNILKQGH